MEYLLNGLIGVASGVIGGMGMGGGTVLIPLLTMLTSLSQHKAQGVNLISFIPMALVVLIIHIKNKLINFNGILYIIIPAVVFAVGGSLLTTVSSGVVLRKTFGGLLLVLSVFQCFQEKIAKFFTKKGGE